MQTTTRKIQTAFRFDPDLLSRMKLRAKREQKSLNNYVEEVMERENPAETLVWPKVKFPIKARPGWKSMMTDIHFTKEDLEQDERLAYILSKGQRG
jgi:hypothetical protein